MLHTDYSLLFHFRLPELFFLLAVPIPLVNLAFGEAEALGKLSKLALLGPILILLEFVLQDHLLVVRESLSPLLCHPVICVVLPILKDLGDHAVQI